MATIPQFSKTHSGGNFHTDTYKRAMVAGWKPCWEREWDKTWKQREAEHEREKREGEALRGENEGVLRRRRESEGISLRRWEQRTVETTRWKQTEQEQVKKGEDLKYPSLSNRYSKLFRILYLSDCYQNGVLSRCKILEWYEIYSWRFIKQ